MSSIDVTRVITNQQKREQQSRAQNAALRAGALAELATTDWYVLREIEEGIAIPVEVKQRRAAARRAVSDTAGGTTV